MAVDFSLRRAMLDAIPHPIYLRLCNRFAGETVERISGIRRPTIFVVDFYTR